MANAYSTTITPLSFPIPFDVLCYIIGYLDFRTLKTASVLSTECHDEANRWLYRSYSVGCLGITGGNSTEVSRFVAQCRTIIRDPRRSRHIRRFAIGTSLHLAGSDKSSWNKLTLQIICQALQCMPNLRDLRVHVLSGLYDVANALSKQQFPFKLKHLSSNLPIQNGLLGFIQSQPSIESYEKTAGLEAAHDLPFPWLPALKVVHGPLEGIAGIIPGRPVQVVDISKPLWQADIPKLIKVLAESVADVTHLSLTISCQDTRMSDIAAIVPRLRSLTIRHLPSEKSPYAWLTALEGFQYLEELHWRYQGRRMQQSHSRLEAAAECAQHCPSLRRIAIEGMSDRFSDTFLRSESQGWHS